MTQITLIADDPLARAGLTYLINELPQIELIAQGKSSQVGDLLLEKISQPLPLILWDVGWDGVHTLPDWLDDEVTVIALISDKDDASSLRATPIQALLPRQVSKEQLLAAIQAVSQGLFVIAPQFTPVWSPAEPPLPSLNEALTPREMEVLQLLAEGMTNKKIAHQLEISNHTVKFHVTAIMSKLDAQSRTDAVVRATRLGLISL